jgi:hypothetical protein
MMVAIHTLIRSIWYVPYESATDTFDKFKRSILDMNTDIPGLVRETLFITHAGVEPYCDTTVVQFPPGSTAEFPAQLDESGSIRRDLSGIG